MVQLGQCILICCPFFHHCRCHYILRSCTFSIVSSLCPYSIIPWMEISSLHGKCKYLNILLKFNKISPLYMKKSGVFIQDIVSTRNMLINLIKRRLSMKNILPPFWNVGHSGVQILYSNITYSRLRVDQTILIVHRFWAFPNRKMCMQPYRGRCMWRRCMRKSMLL